VVAHAPSFLVTSSCLSNNYTDRLCFFRVQLIPAFWLCSQLPSSRRQNSCFNSFSVSVLIKKDDTLLTGTGRFCFSLLLISAAGEEKLLVILLSAMSALAVANQAARHSQVEVVATSRAIQ
jgi:hypothetical protein